ncbi:MAG: hypothetical protein ABI658_10370 [Acidimicrobiales bacterium]
MATPATAQQDAGTSATVGGGGNTPVIECGWALNDIDHDWNSTPKMQYGQDDSVATPNPTPCTAAGAVATQTTATATTDPQIHVLPNAHDEPTLAWVELWGAVTSSVPAGTIVYFDVYHPDGSFKVQVDATRYASSANPTACSDAAVTSPALAAAVATGQMTSAASANIVSECQNQQKGLWYGAFGISKHQPYGRYTIVMHAAIAGGGEVTLTYYIQVQSFYQLEKDFTNINFGSVGANTHAFQPTAGDFVWDGTNNAANQASTVRNTGNAGIALNTAFASLCLTTAASCTDDKRIDHFDAKFGKTLAGLQAIGDGATYPALTGALVSNLASTAKPAPLGPTYGDGTGGTTAGGFDNNILRTLCPNDPAKIEFSIYTENIQAGSYTASPLGIRLTARPNAICPTDTGSVYYANGYTVSTPTPTSNVHH